MGHTLSASTGIFFSDQKKTKFLVIERSKATDIILERAKQTQLAIQNHEMEKRLAKVSQNPSPPVLIDVGDFVLLDRPLGEHRPKLAPSRLGPVPVVGKERNGRALKVSFHLPSGRQSIRTVRTERAHLYQQDPVISTVDPVILAASDPENFFIVERIVSYTGKLSRPKSLKFLVKWEDYPKEENSLVPLKDLLNNTIFIDWAKNHVSPIIRKLVE